jgi:hypothetical protein
MITKRDITQQRGKKEGIYDASFERIAWDIFSRPGVTEASFNSIAGGLGENRANQPISYEILLGKLSRS